MNKKLEGYKNNIYLMCKKSSYSCPICNNDLYKVKNKLIYVLDGNNVFHCEKDEQHTFWQNSREQSDILHLNINSSSTDFHSEKDYILTNKIWKIVNNEQ